jgi:hypothetical protein
VSESVVCDASLKFKRSKQRKLSLNRCAKENCASLIVLDYDVTVTQTLNCIEIVVIKHSLELVIKMDMEESEFSED